MKEYEKKRQKDLAAAYAKMGKEPPPASDPFHIKTAEKDVQGTNEEMEALKAKSKAKAKAKADAEAQAAAAKKEVKKAADKAAKAEAKKQKEAKKAAAKEEKKSVAEREKLAASAWDEVLRFLGDAPLDTTTKIKNAFVSRRSIQTVHFENSTNSIKKLLLRKYSAPSTVYTEDGHLVMVVPVHTSPSFGCPSPHPPPPSPAPPSPLSWPCCLRRPKETRMVMVD